MATAPNRVTEAPESFAALVPALPPAWKDAALRLAKAAEAVSRKLDIILQPESRGLVQDTEDLIQALIDMIDRLQPDPDLEPSLGYHNGYAV